MSRLVSLYPSKLVARPGDTITFHAHADAQIDCTADLVRIVQGDRSSTVELPVIDAPFAGSLVVTPQPIIAGSSAEVRPRDGLELESWSLGFAVMPTRLGEAGAAIVTALDSAGVRAAIRLTSKGEPLLDVTDADGDAQIRLALRIPTHRWTLLTAVFDRDAGEIRFGARILGQGVADHRGEAEVVIDRAPRPLTMSALRISPAGAFDGKLDSIVVLSRALLRGEIGGLILADAPEHPALVGAIDFASGIGGPDFSGTAGPGWKGRTRNAPSRAVKGVRWSGLAHDWRAAPHQYSAAHFHSDDIYDMEWPASFSWTIPQDLSSGAFAARITDPEGGRAYATVFVEPNTACSDVVLLASTATYLAYANETVSLRLPEMLYGVKPTPPDEYTPLLAHPEIGGSLYEHHADGSGRRTSSWLRPIVNLRPETRMWSFNADTAITAWLERVAPGYDTVTDHGLHERGAAALDGARVVVTGTHPEYVSDEILDALEAFLARGGRLIYMGGNGFYWRTAFSPHFPAAIEIRRAEDGTRAWIEEPGEYHHEFDGRLGGLWRRCGRPPNRLVGVGFAAQGFASAAPYMRGPDADDPRAAFILSGVEGATIGAHGARGGGAASEEIDRYDRALGSPPHALVIASSRGHGPDMLKVKEEFHATTPVLQDRDVRADLTFFETQAGGAVFSTGSIGWSGALATNGYDNDVAKITRNVLDRFRDPTPFSWPKADD